MRRIEVKTVANKQLKDTQIKTVFFYFLYNQKVVRRKQ